MALSAALNVAERTAAESKARGSKTPWKRIHYVTFTEVVDKVAAKAAKDPVEEQWFDVRNTFGEPGDIQKALIALADGSAKTYKFNDDVFLMRLSAEDMEELAKLLKA